MRFLPITSRIAVSAICIADSSGRRTLNTKACASFTRYCTANCRSMMFSSSVSISDSFSTLVRTLLR